VRKYYFIFFPHAPKHAHKTTCDKGVGLNTPMNSIIIGDIFAPNDRALPVALVITADYLGYRGKKITHQKFFFFFFLPSSLRFLEFHFHSFYSYVVCLLFVKVQGLHP
jgi:hypothetical protein